MTNFFDAPNSFEGRWDRFVSEQWWFRNFWLLFYRMEFVSAEEVFTCRGAGKVQSLIGCKSRCLIRRLRWAINATTDSIHSATLQLERVTYAMDVWQVARAESSSRWCRNHMSLASKDDVDRPTLTNVMTSQVDEKQMVQWLRGWRICCSPIPLYWDEIDVHLNPSMRWETSKSFRRWNWRCNDYTARVDELMVIPWMSRPWV